MGHATHHSGGGRRSNWHRTGRIHVDEQSIRRLPKAAPTAGCGEWAQRFIDATGMPDPVAQLITGFGEGIRKGSYETPWGDTESLIGRDP